MIKVTVKEYAKHRDITERSARRYLADGFIPAAAVIHEGRKIFIDRDLADRALAKHAVTRKELLAGSQAKAVKTKQAKMSKVVEQAGTSGLSYQDARTLSQRHKAALLKIELDQRTGKLVDAEKVKAAAFAKARTVRDALLNIPDRIGPVLAAENDQIRVAEILTAEIRTALEELTVC